MAESKRHPVQISWNPQLHSPKRDKQVTLISSRMTFFNKKVFPAIWFGFLAVFLATSSFTNAGSEDVMFLIMPVFLALFGFVMMKKLVWDLADEVFDCGDALLIKSGGKEERIPLSNIMNVSESMFTNPPRVVLRLAVASRMGSEIVFSPPRPFTLNPFAKSTIVEDLIIRVDRTRTHRRL
ncbi:MAG: hypothetical protein JNJ55_13895 [Betaproteobacteria bacterium]|nr:hypothetical protein [Betaproteobacteria bacterium]